MAATISQVAKAANVSKKTVSRVINGEATVAAATRQRVLDAMRNLDYSPNPWAQKLASGKSGIIALLIDDAEASYIMSVMQGIMDAVAGTTYTVSVVRCRIDDPNDVQHVLKMAEHRQIDGCIITPPCDNAVDLLKGLHEQDMPLVLLTPHKHNTDYTWVAAEDEQGSYMATRHLITLGHHRIAYIQGNRRHQASWDRLAGYQRAMDEAGLTIPDEYVLQGEWSFASGVDCAERLLALTPAPTAIVTGGDEIAAGVLQSALKRGLTLPRDLSVVGFDNSPLTQKVWPPLTTVEQPLSAITARAMEILLSNLTQPGDQTHHIVPTRLIVRESTAPPSS